MSEGFRHLFSPLVIRDTVIKNRIFSTGHMTTLVTGGNPNRAMAAYHEARARGGAGLIVIEVATVHESASFTSHTLNAARDDCIRGYAALANAVQKHGCKIFGQLFHPGKENLESIDGTLPVCYAPSAVPNERFHVMPRPMSRKLISEVVKGYGLAAARMAKAGLDGVEIVASHGFLPAQFLNPRSNLRQDEYGGALSNRLRFLSEIIEEVRAQTGPEMVVGLRISAVEYGQTGLTADEVLDACIALDEGGGLDYINAIGGASAEVGAAIHIVPPMSVPNAYLAPLAGRIKQEVSIPVFVGGRINQPQEAEQILAKGQADMCAMTRGLICDPDMPRKAAQGRLLDIRACVGCNQACIGHMHAGFPISCIQNPSSGRELSHGTASRASRSRKVLVAGGGPAGMKAAVTAAERGHLVTLYEASSQLGGQVLLAQELPGRSEFGGVATNLARELELCGVKVMKNTPLTRKLAEQENPDAVILATGAVPYQPRIPGDDEAFVVNAWQVIKNQVELGRRVLVADWRCDWIGMGLAHKLRLAGCGVWLAVNGITPGQTIPQYIRDGWTAELIRLGVRIINYVRLYGVDPDTAYLQNTINGEPIICDDIDMVVLSLGHQSFNPLELAFSGLSYNIYMAGDCLAPRTVEEAVLEGFNAGMTV